MSDFALETIVIEFMGELAEDRVAGRVKPLAEYLARYPGRDAAIAAAYASATNARTFVAQDDGAELGPYRLLRELGRGGQGVVWLAEDVRIGRKVALKLVPKPPTADDITPRLRREAQAAARVDHPGVCAVYDVGSDEQNAWLAMRFVDGQTLAASLEHGQTPSFEGQLLLCERIARALHAAHEAGIVHRDVKPGNVMITPSGEPVVLDFGIARDDLGASLTLTGDALGTPAYMAPEQLRGEHVDRRADVWALGVTAFELLAGARPFDAPTRDALVRKILGEEAPNARRVAPKLSRDLAVVLATALEKDVTRRYATALAFADDLRRVRENEPIQARPASALVRVRRWAQRNPTLAASLAILFATLSAGLAITWTLLARTSDALARRDRLVRDVANLSDQTAAAALVAEEAELWPASEPRVPALEAWLARADALIARRREFAAAQEAVAARNDLDPDPERNLAARAWLAGQIETLIASLDELVDLRVFVAERLDFARSVRTRSLVEPGDAWTRAAAEIAADARYGGLALAPQVGLVPLGRDPRSGLQEFAHLASGAVPSRDVSGKLALDADSAIVLVLIPASEFTRGARAPDDEHALGAPNVDPWVGRWDGPPARVALDAFFIGKHEVTQAQWERHERANPAQLSGAQNRVPATERERLPVETVSWRMARAFAEELSLTLPTEARWECAARAGTTTIFYTGDDVASLSGHANVADAFARGVQEISNWRYATELDDGALDVMPIGSYAANPFGLHDVHGNVAEWCLDSWEDLALVTSRPGDGLLIGEAAEHVQRGGSFSRHPTDARCAARAGSRPDFISPQWGLRVARGVER